MHDVILVGLLDRPTCMTRYIYIYIKHIKKKKNSIVFVVNDREGYTLSYDCHFRQDGYTDVTLAAHRPICFEFFDFFSYSQASFFFCLVSFLSRIFLLRVTRLDQTMFVIDFLLPHFLPPQRENCAKRRKKIRYFLGQIVTLLGASVTVYLFLSGDTMIHNIIHSEKKEKKKKKNKEHMYKIHLHNTRTIISVRVSYAYVHIHVYTRSYRDIYIYNIILIIFKFVHIFLIASGQKGAE